MSLDVKFSATDAGFTQTISKVKNSVKEMDDGVKDAGNGVNTSFAAMAKAGAGLAIGIGAVKAVFSAITGTLGEFKGALDLGGELSDLSSRTGETAGNLLILQRAFDNAGVGADKVGSSINKLQKFMEDAARGGKRQSETLDALGLTYDDLSGKTPTEQMALLAERISGIEHPGKRAAFTMQVFGGKAGDMLPLLTNFSGEMENAQKQLGSMPGVMDRSANSFDAISDNIEVAKGKFLEFAAGLLESVSPAIELVTTLLTRFDAAGAGMKLGEIITGASKAMGGFGAALDAIKLGEFSMAFEIAFTSIKLQAKDSINSIMAYLKASASFAGKFLSNMFASDGALMQSLSSVFQILINNITLAFSEGMRSILKHIPGIGKAIDQALYDVSANAAAHAEMYTAYLGKKLGEVPAQFIESIEKGNVAFDHTLEIAKDIVDTTSDEEKLRRLILELAEKTRQTQQEQLEIEKQQVSLGVHSISKRRDGAEILAEIERDIVKAKADGNEKDLKELEIEKKYFQLLEKGLAQGLTYEKAIETATLARKLAMQEVLKKTKDVTGELKKQVELSDKLAGDREKAEEKRRGVDPRDRHAERHARLLEQGNFSAAKNLEANLEQKERLKRIRDALDEPMKSLQDLMKENGLPRIRKTTDEMLTALEEVAEIAKAEKKEKDEKKKKPDAMKKDEEKKDTMHELVSNIRDLVAKIEPKLPQRALV
jgi:hypothetical protein